MTILNDLHQVLFNAVLLFSLAIGVWATVMAARNRSISGQFWGAISILTLLSFITLTVGMILWLTGFRVPRVNTYFIYMAWMVIIIPGMFTQLRGRDDASAALAFAMLSVFNFFVGLSMLSRGLIGPWQLG
jgi:hypothetical protein